MLGTNCEEYSKGSRLDNRCKGLEVINALLLPKSLSNKTGLEPGYLTIRTMLLLQHEFAANDIADCRGLINKVPGVSFLDCSKFLQNGRVPFILLRSS